MKNRVRLNNKCENEERRMSVVDEELVKNGMIGFFGPRLTNTDVRDVVYKSGDDHQMEVKLPDIVQEKIYPKSVHGNDVGLPGMGVDPE